MTPDTAPEAIIQAEQDFIREVAELNADMPEAFSSAVDRAAAIELAVTTATTLARHRRLASQDAGEGLREAAQAVIDRMFGTHKARNGREVGIQGDDGEKCWIVHSDDIETLRRALLTPPSDAGSTTREGGEGGERVSVPRRYVQHLIVCDLNMRMGAKCQCGLSAPGVVRPVAALTPTPSPDASPDSGEGVRKRGPAGMASVQIEAIVRAVMPHFRHLVAFSTLCEAVERALANTPSPDASPDSGEKYADMDIDERAAAMADDGVGDPWELLGFFREKLRQSKVVEESAREAATRLALRLRDALARPSPSPAIGDKA